MKYYPNKESFLEWARTMAYSYLNSSEFMKQIMEAELADIAVYDQEAAAIRAKAHRAYIQHHEALIELQNHFKNRLKSEH